MIYGNSIFAICGSQYVSPRQSPDCIRHARLRPHGLLSFAFCPAAMRVNQAKPYNANLQCRDALTGHRPGAQGSAAAQDALPWEFERVTSTRKGLRWNPRIKWRLMRRNALRGRPLNDTIPRVDRKKPRSTLGSGVQRLRRWNPFMKPDLPDFLHSLPGITGRKTPTVSSVPSIEGRAGGLPL
jgi:hypothetical protein